MATLNYDVTMADVKWVRSYQPSKNQILIEEFLKSGKDVAEIKYGNKEFRQKKSIYNSFYNTLRRMHCKTVKIVMRGDRAFLVRINPN